MTSLLAITVLLAFLDSHPDTGLVGGRLSWDDGAPQPSVGRFPGVLPVALAGLAARCIDYKREHGKYPAGLGDLKDVEPDPLTGRPFVLETRAEGILLRSERRDETADREIEWELGG